MSGNPRIMQFLIRNLELLKVNEIFYSIQGESSFAGIPCVFIRLSGCNLRCTYCDTRYAFTEGKKITIDQIIQKVNQYQCPIIEITGGEPLLQDETIQLAEKLCQLNYTVLIETNGTQDIRSLPKQVIRIIDIKCPGSGENKKINWNILNQLESNDELKFVVSSLEDYQWAKKIILEYNLIEKSKILISPVYNKLHPRILAEWILQDKLNIRLQIQLHKTIWFNQKQGK